MNLRGTTPPTRQRAASSWVVCLAAALLTAACGNEVSIDAPNGRAPSAPAFADSAVDADLVARGAYLATVGNCAGCHTAPGGAAMAGGLRIETPYGAVYTGNLTPDLQTGLGGWTADDFHRAMHDGRAPDGRRYAPAFPYPSFTHVARADNDALFAYLQSLPPVQQANRPHELRFPYGTQVALAVWQWITFTPADAPTVAPSAGVARGAYLVRGLGHCGECHAPRDHWSAAASDLSGGEMPGARWYAPSLHPTLGSADALAQTVALLRDGRNSHGTVTGPMATVVLKSTQHWRAADLEQAARYLQSLPPAPPAAEAAPAAATLLAAGARLYADRCADCHGNDGAGVPDAYPALAGNPSVTQPSVRNLVQLLRHGGFAPTTAAQPRPFGMPPADLSPDQTAAVLTHLRQAWGHRATAVSALDVLKAN
ncbi:MAG: cytochrome c [Piscinibacter sp.]|uniref:cytochrome c n=1 Tax=Piscinibacter sp. TaxID=1903157 RepID=UPI002585DFA7|nr:cytochrome c [Piscinibacter sp.]MCW5662879.1 cytochrome c [Piscinibacter sp.]